MKDAKFAVAVNCMDGRVQVPVINFLKEKYGVDYVDMITEPGPDKILAENRSSSAADSIRKRVEISITKHFSKLIAVVAHYDCAGNPVDREIHIKHLHAAVETVKSWGFDADVIGLWVDDKWQVHEVIGIR
ncbi:MAG: hypothetical protein XD50_0571 [Clostridia bacterium 41_269]|nr:MAG: hypothetical protein XD50_0571 [Clostridia bacterium 41_269]